MIASVCVASVATSGQTGKVVGATRWSRSARREWCCDDPGSADGSRLPRKTFFHARPYRRSDTRSIARCLVKTFSRADSSASAPTRWGSIPTHFDRHFLAWTRGDGWHHTRWDRTEAVFATEGKVHVAVDFTRYREDGSVIGHYFSLYIVTCQDGHWGIQVGSGNGT